MTWFQSLTWTDCGLIVCSLGSFACLFRPRAFFHRSGAILMGTVLVVIAAICIAVSGLVAAASLFAARRDRIGYCDRRNAEQMRHHDNIEAQRFAWRVARNPKELGRTADSMPTRIQITRADLPTLGKWTQRDLPRGLRKQAG